MTVNLHLWLSHQLHACMSLKNRWLGRQCSHYGSLTAAVPEDTFLGAPAAQGTAGTFYPDASAENAECSYTAGGVVSLGLWVGRTLCRVKASQRPCLPLVQQMGHSLWTVANTQKRPPIPKRFVGISHGIYNSEDSGDGTYNGSEAIPQTQCQDPRIPAIPLPPLHRQSPRRSFKQNT